MNLRDTIRTIPDFPKSGIMYRDITTLLTNPKALADAVKQLAAPYRDKDIDNVAGIEARGFTFGTAVAVELGAGFVPVVDDLIATGGTAEATIKLLQKTKANIVGAAFVIDLPELNGVERLIRMGVPVTTLVKFDGH